MAQSDITIIGGGISGLSLAHYCAAAGLDTTLLEKSDRIGGAFHSERIDDEASYWVELGAHTCYNSYQNLLRIVDDCQLAGDILPRHKAPFRVLLDEQLQSVFSQINYFELLRSLPQLFFQEKSGQSVADYYSKIVGPKNYSRLFRHFFDAVPSQSTSDFPADALFKKRPRRKDVLKSYTFTRGLSTVADAIAESDGINIETGKETRSVELENGIYCITTEDGSRYETSSLALATPAPVSARLLQQVHPELSAKLAKIETATVNSVGVVAQKKAVPIESVAGIVSPGDLFYSAVSRDVVPDDQFRGFTFHFRPEVTDARKQLDRISEVLQIRPAQIEYVISKQNVLPALRVGHGAFVNEVDALLGDPGLLLTGNYFSGVAIEDCVSRSLLEFSRLRDY